MQKIVFVFISFFLLQGPSFAVEIKLSGSEISELLNDNVLYGEDNGQSTDQIFQNNGVTYYHVGAGQSQGKWKVQNNQFCSQWPPNQSWACYNVSRDDKHVIFIAKSGIRTDMLLAN